MLLHEFSHRQREWFLHTHKGQDMRPFERNSDPEDNVAVGDEIPLL